MPPELRPTAKGICGTLQAAVRHGDGRLRLWLPLEALPLQEQLLLRPQPLLLQLLLLPGADVLRMDADWF